MTPDAGDPKSSAPGDTTKPGAPGPGVSGPGKVNGSAAGEAKGAPAKGASAKGAPAKGASAKGASAKGASATGHSRSPEGDELSERDELSEQLDLPLDGLIDWGTDPREAEKQLAAQTEEALVAAERDEYLDALRRLQADFDNFRKRSMRQQTELLERATEGLCVRLLPVLDALDLATAHVRSQGEKSDAAKALEQIDSLLRDILAREGIERIDAVGVRFDPTIHDAVGTAAVVPPSDAAVTAEAATAAEAAQAEPGGEPEDEATEPGDSPQPGDDGLTVAQVMRAGYRLKSKVLRPAMVLVGG